MDVPFPSYPDHLGHWAELIVPIANTLASGTWQEQVQHPSLSSPLHLEGGSEAARVKGGGAAGGGRPTEGVVQVGEAAKGARLGQVLALNFNKHISSWFQATLEAAIQLDRGGAQLSGLGFIDWASLEEGTDTAIATVGDVARGAPGAASAAERRALWTLEGWRVSAWNSE
ncbi:hypothetical protein HaLaN_03719 [Haematococcus lacustris]|uniref:Uncharacterized protein n=1 Tax=Haematococcus lacustris TaxID=44745 RepID=A0A699YL72_HAELA|nr:hypothetical protein HaLaN_03719 [Haematococcus lacustris]